MYELAARAAGPGLRGVEEPLPHDGFGPRFCGWFIAVPRVCIYLSLAEGTKGFYMMRFVDEGDTKVVARSHLSDGWRLLRLVPGERCGQSWHVTDTDRKTT